MTENSDIKKAGGSTADTAALTNEINSLKKALAEKEEELKAERVGKREFERGLKEREQKLRTSEEKYRLLTESSHDLIYTVSREYRILYINRTSERIFGVPPGEMKGKSIDELFPPEIAANYQSYVDEVFVSGKNFVIKVELKTAVGIMHLESNLLPLRDEDGTVFKVMGVSRDITEQTAYEQKLLRVQFEVSERVKELNTLYKLSRVLSDHALGIGEMLEAAVRVLPEGFYKPENTRCLIVFDGAEYGGKGSGYKGEWISAPIIVDGTERGRITAVLIKKVLTPAENLFLDEEFKLLEKAAENIAFSIEKKLNDIKIRNTVAELERSNTELEQFAYIASHDLQEPLRTISSYTRLLETRYANKLDEDAKDFINFAVDGANRMQRLINDLLAYSRISTRRKPHQTVETSAAAGQVLVNLQTILNETRAVVTNSGLPAIYGDESQITRLFQNLIENSIKYRGENPPLIHINAEQRGDKVLFAVSDNGIGFEEEYKEKIFQIFQRLHSRSNYPGTGIGLAICRKITELHGGTIWAESEHGKGSTFYFTLNAVPR